MPIEPTLVFEASMAAPGAALATALATLTPTIPAMSLKTD